MRCSTGGCASPSDAVVTHETRFADGRWQAESLTLRLESGLPFSAELDTQHGAPRPGLDGSQHAARGARAEPSTTRAEHETGVALARQMLAVGFLELAD